MVLSYCEKYGFDEPLMRRWLSWLQLTPSDHALARRLQELVIIPHVEEIVDDFYAWMGGIDELQPLLGNGKEIARLKVTQTEYLLSLGMGFDHLNYFESRLRVGQAHAWVGLDLSMYQISYFWLGRCIMRHFPAGLAQEAGEAGELVDFLRKITSLDMSLAIETYHTAQVNNLEESLLHSRRREDRLRHAASTDALTGIANHDAILTELESALVRMKQGHGQLAVLMADLDLFKDINDSYGHLVGDKVLHEVSRRMLRALRDFDQVGRYGGEEFLFILDRTSEDEAMLVAERVRLHIADSPMNLHDLSLPVTISIGVTCARPGDSAEDIIDRADGALYAAKAAGRNRVILR